MTEMKIHPVITKLAGITTKDGTYYELQEIAQYDENDNLIPHYDGEESWFRVARTSPTGMPMRTKDFGPDEHKAYAYLKNRR